jgi:hypothetical protein
MLIGDGRQVRRLAGIDCGSPPSCRSATRRIRTSPANEAKRLERQGLGRLNHQCPCRLSRLLPVFEHGRALALRASTRTFARRCQSEQSGPVSSSAGVFTSACGALNSAKVLALGGWQGTWRNVDGRTYSIAVSSKSPVEPQSRQR